MTRFRFNRRHLVILFAVALIVALGAGTVRVVAPDVTSQTDAHPGLPALAQARALWATRPFVDYRITVEYPGQTYDSPPCIQDLEVHGDMVKATANACNLPLLTVDGLFKRIEQELADVHWINGAGCDLLAIYPAYNAKLGYPEAIEYRQEYPGPTNARPSVIQAYKDHMGSSGPCSLMAMLQKGTKVTSLTPLPTGP